MKKLLLALVFLTSIAWGQLDNGPLPPDQAFQISAQLAPDHTVLLHWLLADKHYLYQERFGFKVLNPTTASIGAILYPAGVAKTDQFFGNHHAYYNNVTIPIPILQADPNNTVLQVNYQGCAEGQYCYPPMTRLFKIDFSANQITSLAVDIVPAHIPSLSPQEKITHLLEQHNYAIIFLAFIGIGLLLAFTPCVLPMIPILSAIIVGQREQLTLKRGFSLSLSYVVGMSVAYALIGGLVGWLGGNLQISLQKPWLVILLALLFVLLALSLFGLFELKLPDSLQNKLSNLSNQQKRGSTIGTFIMGFIASLIVSPCVTPALVGTLAYIGQSGNPWLGVSALFAMGLGMGIPLLIIGTAGSRWLPKPGAWLSIIKKILGILMLAIAVWLSMRLLPSSSAQTMFTPIKNITELQSALAHAKLKKQYTLVDIYADWCIACKTMDVSTFKNPAVKAKLSQFQLLRANVTANDPTDQALEKYLGVIAPPTMVFFNSQGQLLKSATIVGEISAAQLLKRLETIP